MMKLCQAITFLGLTTVSAMIVVHGSDEEQSSEESFVSDDRSSLIQAQQALAKVLKSMNIDTTKRFRSSMTSSDYDANGSKAENQDKYFWLLFDDWLDPRTLARKKKSYQEIKSNDDSMNFGERFGLKDRYRTRKIPKGVEECPIGDDDLRLFLCPTPDVFGKFKCIEDKELCNQNADCPNAEDEDKTACMFRNTTKAYLELVIEALLRLFRSCIHLMDSQFSFNGK